MRLAIEEGKFGIPLPIHPNWFAVVGVCGFFVTAAGIGMLGVAMRTEPQSHRLVVGVIDVFFVLVAVAGCSTPLSQARTLFTELGIVRWGIWSTRMLPWDRVRRVRTGLAYTLETDETSITINPYLFRIVIGSLVALVGGYLRARITPEALRARIEREIPVGTSADKVIAFLDSVRAHHSGLTPDHSPTFSSTGTPEFSDAAFSMRASIRGFRKGNPLADGVFLEFKFDRHDRLLGYQVEYSFTGP